MNKEQKKSDFEKKWADEFILYINDKFNFDYYTQSLQGISGTDVICLSRSGKFNFLKLELTEAKKFKYSITCKKNTAPVFNNNVVEVVVDKKINKYKKNNITTNNIILLLQGYLSKEWIDDDIKNNKNKLGNNPFKGIYYISFDKDNTLFIREIKNAFLKKSTSTNFIKIIFLTLASALHFPYRLMAGLRLPRSRVNTNYQIGSDGIFTIFRESFYQKQRQENPCVLVVHFRFRLLRSSPLGHWLVKPLSHLTTPCWSGFPGFRIKLWLINKQTKNYIGIYEWAGEDNLARYESYLLYLLKIFAVRGSVWHQIFPATTVDSYLAKHLVK